MMSTFKQNNVNDIGRANVYKNNGGLDLIHISPPLVERFGQKRPRDDVNDTLPVNTKNRKLLTGRKRAQPPVNRSIKVIKFLTGGRRETLDDWVTAQLRQDQKKAVAWMLRTSQENGCAVLAADMGFGKTLTALSALAQLYLAMPVKRPSLVLVATSFLGEWRKQMQQHMAPEVLANVVFIKAKSLDGVRRINKHQTWLVVASYESLKSKRPEGSMLRDIEYDTLVADEAHRVRNVDTLLFETVRKVQRQRFWALTGTPLQNKVIDIASLLVTGGAFRIQKKLTPASLKRAILRNPDDFFKTFRACYLRIAKIEGFENCELLPFIHARPFKPAEQAVYDLELKRNLTEAGEKKDIGWFTRALFGCAESEAKHDMIRVIINKFLNKDGTLKRKIIIFSTAIKAQSAIAEFCTSLGFRTGIIQSGKSDVERSETISEFFDDQYDILVLAFRACNEGFNIQCASVVIFADMAWPAPQPFKQGERRAYRPGQPESEVYVYTLVISGTLEAHIPHMHAIKLRKGEAMCAAMCTLDDFRPDGTKINDPSRTRMARVEFNIAIQMEKKSKKSAYGFSFTNNKQVREFVTETLSPSAYLENYFQTYQIGEEHRKYLFGKEAFTEGEETNEKEESRARARVNRDRAVLEMAQGISEITVFPNVSWFAKLSPSDKGSGLFDDWFGTKQLASDLFSDRRFDEPCAQINNKEQFKVLLVDPAVFSRVLEDDDGVPSYSRISTALYYVRNKILGHSASNPDADQRIHMAAAKIKSLDTLAIGAETMYGTMYLPGWAKARRDHIRSLFDRSSVNVMKKDDDDWEGFLDDMF